MAHGVVETQLMQAEYDGSKIRTIRFTKDTDNGLVFALDKLEAGQREVYGIKDAAAGDTVEKGSLVLVCTPEGEIILDEFVNKAKALGRGHVLCVGDKFGVTADCLTGTPKAGQYVKVTAGGKLTVAAAATGAIGLILDCYNGIWGIQILPTQA